MKNKLDRSHHTRVMEAPSTAAEIAPPMQGVVHIRASAGSGKTTQLVKRYLDVLLHEACCDETPGYDHPAATILALTFANKAGNEMKQRILKALKEQALKQQRNGVRSRHADKTTDLVWLVDELLRRYHLFQVQTIDSFVNMLLVVSSFQLGLTHRFQITERPDRYLKQALDAMLERFSCDPGIKRAVDDFLDHHLTQPHAGWFPYQDLMDVMRRMFDDGMVYGPCDETSSLESQDVMALKKNLAANLRGLIENMPPGLNRTKIRPFEKFAKPSGNNLSFTVRDLPKALGQAHPPWNASCSLEAEERRMFERQWRRCCDLARRWVEADARSWYQSHHALFRAFLEELDAVKKDADVVFLEELNRLAEPLLAQGHLPPSQIALQLGTRLRHILIDEFQDTSPLQWANIKPLMDEVLAQGGSVFLVGDEKQAIYGFRGSDAEGFRRLPKEFAHAPVVERVLEDNWRSATEIVDFNNRVFSFEHLAEFIDQIPKIKKDCVISDEDKQDILHAYRSSRQNNAVVDRGWVRVEPVSDEEAIRAFIIQALDEVIQAGGEYQDVAVLTRSNREAEKVTAWLMAQKIPVLSDRTLDVRAHPLIQEILAFLRFLASPIDSRSLTEFMLGDLFAAVSGWDASQVQSFLFEAVSEEGTPLYLVLQRRHPKVWDEIFDVFFRKAGVFPVYEYITAIIGRFDVLRRFPEQVGFVMQFLEFVKNRGQDTPDLAGFLQHEDLNIEDRFSVPPRDVFVSLPPQPQALRVMTVHKAKGLQFPVVILPFLGLKISPYGSGQRPCERETTPRGWRYCDMTRDRIHFSDHLKGLYEKACGRALREELNVLYVALTRAQKALYAAMPEKIGSHKNFISHLIPAEPSWRRVGDVRPLRPSAQRSASDPSSMDEGNRRVSAFALKDWVASLIEEWPLEAAALRRLAERRRGQRLHALLADPSWGVVACSSNDADHCHACRERVTALFPHLPEEEKRWLMQQRHRLMADPMFSFLRRNEAREVMVEQELVDPEGRTIRVDRLMVFDDEVWVIDFKTGDGQHKEHHTQVAAYCRLMQQRYPEKRVKGFLIYVTDRCVREVSAKEA